MPVRVIRHKRIVSGTILKFKIDSRYKLMYEFLSK